MFNYLKRKIKGTGKGTVDYVGKIVGAKEIKKTADWIIEMGKIAFIPKKSTRVETFQEAKERMGLSEKHFSENRRTFIITFYICLFLACFCLGGAIINLSIGAYSTAGIWTAIVLIQSALCFTYSFRAYQIKTRTLCTVKEWYVNKAEWLPH